MLSKYRERFISVRDTDELKSRVSDVVPLKENEFVIDSVVGSVQKFKAELRCAFKSHEEFVDLYKEKTGETLRQRKKQRSKDGMTSSYRYML